jgi:hypothetical protein
MFRFLPPVSRRTRAWTAGMRVDPPTRRTSSISFADGFRVAHRLLDRPHAALDQLSGEIVGLGRMIVMVRCLGQLASAVTNGRFTCLFPSVAVLEEFHGALGHFHVGDDVEMVWLKRCDGGEFAPTALHCVQQQTDQRSQRGAEE